MWWLAGRKGQPREKRGVYIYIYIFIYLKKSPKTKKATPRRSSARISTLDSSGGCRATVTWSVAGDERSLRRLRRAQIPGRTCSLDLAETQLRTAVAVVVGAAHHGRAMTPRKAHVSPGSPRHLQNISPPQRDKSPAPSAPSAPSASPTRLVHPAGDAPHKNRRSRRSSPLPLLCRGISHPRKRRCVLPLGENTRAEMMS